MADSPIPFEIHPASGVPIYRQLVDQVHALVAGGALRRGDFLPSVRQVAKGAAINPMTVSKAYARLEVEGVVERLRGQGMRVKGLPSGGTRPQRKAQFRSFVQPALHRGRQLGLTDAQILESIKRLLRE